jgi:uncharacterized membrane protein YeiH
MIFFLDLFGTLIFALSGAFRAVKYELDILGVIILSSITGVGGGIIRDLLLGNHPPNCIRNEYYIAICIFSGLMVFFFAEKLAKQWRKIIISDALGLGVFTYIGALTAYTHELGPISIIIMATLTATGGGILRDILVSEIPAVLKSGFYATASISGAVVFIVLTKSDLLNNQIIAVVTVVITTSLRLYAMNKKTELPKVKKLPDSPSNLSKKS